MRSAALGGALVALTLAAPAPAGALSRGDLVVSDQGAFGGSGGLIKGNPNTGKESKVSANDQPVNPSSQLFAAPAGIDRNARGKILVTDFSAFGGPGGVIKVNPETGKESKLSANDQPVNSSHQLFS